MTDRLRGVFRDARAGDTQLHPRAHPSRVSREDTRAMPLARAFCATPTRVVPARASSPRASLPPRRAARASSRARRMAPKRRLRYPRAAEAFRKTGPRRRRRRAPSCSSSPRPCRGRPRRRRPRTSPKSRTLSSPRSSPSPSRRNRSLRHARRRSRRGCSRTPPRTPPPPRRTPPRRMLFRNRLKPLFRVGRLGARAPSSGDSRCAATTPASRRTRARSRLGTTCTRRGATRSRETKVRWARSRRVTGSTAYTPIRRLMPVKATCDTSSTRPARRVCR